MVISELQYRAALSSLADVIAAAETLALKAMHDDNARLFNEAKVLEVGMKMLRIKVEQLAREEGAQL